MRLVAPPVVSALFVTVICPLVSGNSYAVKKGPLETTLEAPDCSQ